MGNKVTIIGAGSVGSTIAYTMVVKGIASEIVLIDINKEKALGEAMDIYQGVLYASPAKVYAGEYADAVGSDIVVVTSGIARKPGQTRLDLAQTNVNITKSIMGEIVKYAPDAIYVIVSNPVDVLTYECIKISGIPEKHIIGSGTSLDTARLCATLAERYQIDAKSVHATVYGEHGDSSFVPWSLAKIDSVPVDDYEASLVEKPAEMPALDHAEVEDFVRKSGGIVIKRKGATFHAIAATVSNLCACILNGVNTILTVSSMLHGEYGIEDVCLSMPTVIGRDGIVNRIVAPLTEEEVALMHKSAESLKEVISNIQF